ncbi:MAG: glycosyltransferase family 9 protein [Capsulimonadales bacterium]|nr:glycosyltransferase family 9 protein [Capsulimonadales bacterium]
MIFRRTSIYPVRRVVVLTKHHYMGDTIVAVPLLRAARSVYPGAEITLLTGKMGAVALQECPYIDSIHCYNPRDRHYSSGNLRKALFGDERPDVCLISDRSFRSAWIGYRLGARIRAGFASEGRAFLLTHRVPYRKNAPEIECFLDILRAVAPEGKDRLPYDPTPQLFLSDSERQRGMALLREREAIGPFLVGLQAGASYPAKQWTIAGFAAVADALASDGHGIVLLGSGKAETDAARQLRQVIPHVPLVDLTGATTLRETMGVLSHLSLFIGNDTGVNHMAASLGISTIGLFGPTRADKWGHDGPRGIVLSAPEGDLSRLEPGPVIDAARRLLHHFDSTPVALGIAR